MSLTDLQFSYNGLLMGDGTVYDVVAVRGLVGPGQARVSDVLRPLDHGAFVNGGDYAPIRHVEIDVQIEGTSDSAFSAAVDALGLAMAPQAAELPMTFQLPGFSNGNRFINCRPRGTTATVDVSYKFRMPVLTVVLEATDPRIYDATLQTLGLSPGSASGGLSFPLHWPLSFGTATSGTIQAVNAGTFETRPVITLTGPLTTPKIINTSTGQFTQLDLVLANGQTATIDYLARTIVNSTGGSLYSTLDPTSQWWTLAPGTTNIQFQASSGSGSASIAFRNAWI